MIECNYCMSRLEKHEIRNDTCPNCGGPIIIRSEPRIYKYQIKEESNDYDKVLKNKIMNECKSLWNLYVRLNDSERD